MGGSGDKLFFYLILGLTHQLQFFLSLVWSSLITSADFLFLVSVVSSVFSFLFFSVSMLSLDMGSL